jgi:hypothetical protein
MMIDVLLNALVFGMMRPKLIANMTMMAISPSEIVALIT